MKLKRNWVTLAATTAIVALSAGAFSASVYAGDKAEKTAAKSASEPMAKIDSAAPDFTLTDTDGKQHKLSDYTAQGKVVVLEWFNSGCPYVKRHYDKYTTMRDTAAKHGDKVVWLAINSGAPGKEGHGKDAQARTDWKIAYPVLLDESGQVGKLYGAKTTPHMFVIDPKGILVYAGAIDNDPKDAQPADKKTNYVAQALDEVIAGKPVSTKETKAYGCSVKYGS
ncbi:MAG: redoxin domain-containing protein [Planctomycetota bacterium]|nr:redoxin domain-containing protein [Planctomycetota bacterium]